MMTLQELVAQVASLQTRVALLEIALGRGSAESLTDVSPSIAASATGGLPPAAKPLPKP